MSGAHFKKSASIGATDTLPSIVPPVSAVPSQPAETPGTTANTKANRHVVPKVLAGVVLAAAIVYLGGAAYFSGHYFPGTSVNGNNISFQTPESFATAVSNKAKDYKAHVEGHKLSFDIAGTDIDLSVDSEALAADVKSQQNAFLWPAEIFKTHAANMDTTVTFNADKLTALIAPQVTNVNKDATQPQNATLKFDEAESKFTVVDEVAGTAVDEAATTKLVSAEITALQTSIALDDSCLVQPAITKDSDTILNAQKAANAFMVGEIKLTFAGNTAATVTNKEIGSWVVVGADGTVSLNTEAISTWANDTLTPKLNTVGTERTYTRPDGKTIKVSGGEYGWQVDAGALATALATQVSEGKNSDLEIPTSQQAGAWNGLGKQDWGNTYIDVDYTTQHAIMYKDGKQVWESDFVSGNSAKNYDSPTGVYVVNGNKGTNQTLIGLDYNKDGEPDYKSHVDYWIPFVDNMIAFHDAPWRSSFGGTVYQTNGSHGCINLPASAAAELYNLADVGTVVVCHY